MPVKVRTWGNQLCASTMRAPGLELRSSAHVFARGAVSPATPCTGTQVRSSLPTLFDQVPWVCFEKDPLVFG